jgi:CRP/FNR family transcriptional regulator, cyclic AMP receptor protein
MASAQSSTLIQELAALGVQRRYRRGTVLINEGDIGDTLFIVVSGKLRAYSADDKGKEVTYGIYGAGDYVGEMSLDGGPRSADVMTMEPTVCSVVTRETLLRFIQQRPEFALELIAKLIRRARLATDTARSIALVDVYGRLTQWLNSAAQVQVDGRRIIVQRVTHQELAHHLACSREMVSRLLKDLEKGGYIELDDRRIVLLSTLPARW